MLEIFPQACCKSNYAESSVLVSYIALVIRSLCSLSSPVGYSNQGMIRAASCHRLARKYKPKTRKVSRASPTISIILFES